jgi:hypothetical protein
MTIESSVTILSEISNLQWEQIIRKKSWDFPREVVQSRPPHPPCLVAPDVAATSGAICFHQADREKIINEKPGLG